MPQPGLLTVTEYLALGETEHGYDELVEGRVVLSPNPGPAHAHALVELAIRLNPQLPSHLEIIPGVDVNLELAPPEAPGFTRRPDLIVVRRSARDRVRAGGGMIRAAEVEIVVEYLSPAPSAPIR